MDVEKIKKETTLEILNELYELAQLSKHGNNYNPNMFFELYCRWSNKKNEELETANKVEGGKTKCQCIDLI